MKYVNTIQKYSKLKQTLHFIKNRSIRNGALFFTSNSAVYFNGTQ